MNTFVVPREQLCFQCHDLKLDKKYIHGPLASGGCTACHDPHSSKYRYFLLSESDSFCLRCHDRQAIDRIGAHAGVGDECMSCHDAHMSDKKYLLR
jgi:predicted CXXCH cytochrome family protein